MHRIFLDFESFWSTDVTLKKMSPGEYLAHPEFEVISCSIRVDRKGEPPGQTQCYWGEDAIRAALIEADIANAFCVAHNMNGFDALILVWKLNLHPKLFCCTLQMARPVYGHVTNLGLGALVKFLGIGTKNDAVLQQTKGRHLRDFTEQEREEMAVYNCDDTNQCADIFYHLVPFFTASEFWQIDCTIRARAYPELELDEGLLEDTLVKEKSQKRTDLLELADALAIESYPSEDATFEAVRARLASTPKFVELLESLGVDVPYKPSPSRPDTFIPALAKTDEGFLALLEDADPLVAQAASARLSIKSTLLETRIGRLLTARRTATALPVPYRYWGAKVTGRWSGEEYNMQNLPRILAAARNSDALRQSIVARDGYVIGVADQSGIELRVNHTLWRVHRSMKLYAESPKADLYRDFASVLYSCAVADVSAFQRQIGKVSHLGLGFGAGPTTYMRFARVQGGVNLDIEQSTQITYGWRDTYFEIPEGWQRCQEALYYIAEGTERAIDPGGLCHTVKDGIVLPSGHVIRYPNLRQVVFKDEKTGKEKIEWVYGVGRFTRRIYGPKMDENIVQAIARDTVSEDAINFFKETGYRWKAMTHDELIYLWPEAEAASLLSALQNTMRTPRKWWPSLVLWSEGGIGNRYSEAK